MTASSAWPALPLPEWRATRDTVHLWTQVVGKIRMANTPLVNHWWNVPLYLTARGFTTSPMQHASGESFQIDLDFHEHRLVITTTSGAERSVPMQSGPVRDFYLDVMRQLDELGLHTTIWPVPVEIAGAIPFLQDDVHGTYDPDQAHRFWLALTRMRPVLETFRSRFIGKSSPVHLWWGGLDLATTRFSGRTAPPHPGGVPNCGPQVMLEAYSHEVSSCGYWPDGADEGLFYSYAYPQPPGFEQGAMPPGASWSADMSEYVLPYDVVRKSGDPQSTLLAFLQSSYEAAANTAHWDRAHLERPGDGLGDVGRPPVGSREVGARG
jgi:hypothetical protein